MVSMIAEQLSKKYIKVFIFSKKIQKRFYKSTKTFSNLSSKMPNSSSMVLTKTIPFDAVPFPYCTARWNLRVGFSLEILDCDYDCFIAIAINCPITFELIMNQLVRHLSRSS